VLQPISLLEVAKVKRLATHPPIHRVSRAWSCPLLLSPGLRLVPGQSDFAYLITISWITIPRVEYYTIKCTGRAGLALMPVLLCITPCLREWLPVSSANLFLPCHHLNGTQYLEGHWMRQLTFKKAGNDVLKRRILYCVAHCDLCNQNIDLLWWCGGILVSFLFQVACVQTSQLHHFVSILFLFSFFLSVVVSVWWNFVPTCMTEQISYGPPFSY